jgi:uncharacterized protein (TIGR02145 family)
MKKCFMLIVCILVCCTIAFTQNITLTFTAKDAANHYEQLNRVFITNLTKGWQETIYWPDTILIMQNETGINDVEICGRASLQLSQNNPNPFAGITKVSLMVAEKGEVMLDIADVNGKIVGTHNMYSQPGTHYFHITLAAAGTYLMTARQNGQISSIKMVCNDGTDVNNIEYMGSVETQDFESLRLPKSQNFPKYTTTRPFNLGDQMEYVGYATINGSEVESDHISQAQNASQAFVLQFNVVEIPQDGQPCPGSHTVTDFDGNVYNTVQIGNQCWMKENLRSAHYANGDFIEMNQFGFSGISRYAPNNDTSYVSIYGYLYNWSAVVRCVYYAGTCGSYANPSGVRGVCPFGWHVPSDAEWTQMTSYVGSQPQYQCNDSSIYIAKALASTTGWESSSSICAIGNNPSDNNATKFSALPAGQYYSTSSYIFLEFGTDAYFWSATRYSGYDANYYDLYKNMAKVIKAHNNVSKGYSVRCVRD